MEFIFEHSYLFLVLSFLSFFLVKTISNLVLKGKEDINIFLFRILNFTFFLTILVHLFVPEYNEVFRKIMYSQLTLFISFVTYEVSSYYSMYKLGIVTTTGEGKISVKETHNSRIMEILGSFIILIFTIVVLIKIWGFDSALETTGIFGIFIGLIAFTANIWAPDLIAGIILLNTNLINNGNVIGLEGKKYIVFKFGFFETILLDLESNVRCTIKNGKLKDSVIYNYNKPASSTGIRETVTFKIGYNNEIDYNDFFKKVDSVCSKIQPLFFEKMSATNEHRNLHWYITNNGDFAIEVTFIYFLHDLKDIKGTNSARAYFNDTKFELNKLALVEFQKEGLYLDTPILVDGKLLNNLNN